MEEPLKFKNRKNENLFGIIFSPKSENRSKKIGIIISVNAIKYRIGTFRLHTLLARYLCEQGYYVLYFDPSGIGDSEGEFKEKYLIEHYYEIQKGKYSEDIHDAIKYFKDRCQLDKLILFGLCGGAISMLIAAARELYVDGLILLGIPVLHENIKNQTQQNTDLLSIVASEQAKRNISTIMIKLAQWATWKKFFTLKISWKEESKTVLKSITLLLIYPFKKIYNILKMGNNEFNEKLPVSKHPRFNMLFQDSFIKFVKSKRKILFIFGDLDPVTWIFKTEFQDRALIKGNHYEKFYELYILKNSNHIFSYKESQEQLKSTIRNWLIRYYPL